ncbi:MAG TPA: hypothetical protein VGC53_17465 [Vicinamibacteria bacterium]|jgi:hypothetical protein
MIDILALDAMMRTMDEASRLLAQAPELPDERAWKMIEQAERTARLLASSPAVDLSRGPAFLRIEEEIRKQHAMFEQNRRIAELSEDFL